MSEDGSGNRWVIGVVLVLIGSLGQNLGNNLVSLAHFYEHDGKEEHDTASKAVETNAVTNFPSDVELAVIDNKNPNSEGNIVPGHTAGEESSNENASKTVEKVSYFFEHLWGIGTVTFVCSSVLCFIAFGFAAQSLLASLESVQFVSNIAFAKLVHKEDITYTMLISTLLIVGGNALVVIFSGHNSLQLNGAEVFDLYATNSAFHVYLGFAIVILVSCEYTWKRYNHSRMQLRVKMWKHSFVEPLCFCVASAIVGAFAVVNAKNMAMLLASSASTDRSEFKHAPLYIIFFCWIWIVGFWVSRLDKGLDLFPPLFVIPVIQVCFVFFSIVCGGIFFKEFHTFSGSQFVGFCSGVALILFGVYGLAPDSELDFSGEAHAEVIQTVNDNRVNEVVAHPSTAGRRLSFSASILTENTPASEFRRSSGGAGSISGKESRPRRGSMAHPLAALKEIKRVGVTTAEQTSALAPVVRGARRLSVLAASPFYATPEGDSDAKTDSAGNLFRSRTDSIETPGNRFRTRSDSYSQVSIKAPSSAKITEENENDD